MEGDDRSTVAPGRNTGGKATSSKTGEPHYLRASTGSCHDFCKFGRQHAFDAKERRSIPKWLKEVTASPEIKKTVVPAKPVSVSKSMDSGEKYSRSKSIIKREIVKDSPEIKKTVGPAKPVSVSKSMDSGEKYSLSKSIIKREIVKDETPLMVKTRPSSISSKTSNSDPRPAKETKTPSSSSTSKPIKVNSSTANNIGENSRPQRNRDVESRRIIVSKKLTLSSPKVSLSPKPVNRIAKLIDRKQTSRKLVSPRVDSGRRIRKDESSKNESDEVEEKTLYVIKVETNKKSSSHDDGENTENEEENEPLSEIHDVKKVVDKKGNFKKVESPPPSKLSFRRGKVVEIQSHANSPRRLKFRQARLLGENSENPRRRNLKRVGEIERKSTKSGEKSGDKVVLRHRDVQGKKDSRGLFNNVIEETASKLVETRKSKVKALVGAFETVISLQDIKSSR